MKGWVYVMSNQSLSGMVKIGYSMKDPHMRAGNDFDPAGLPDDYIVEYHALVDNPRAIEQQVHTRLKDQRYKKEWFRVTVSEAIANIRTVTSLCGEILLEQILQGDHPTTQSIPILNNFFSNQKLYFSDGLGSYCKDGKWGYVDTGLNVVIPAIYDDAKCFSEGLAAVKITEKYGYVDKQGRFILPPLYEDAHPFKSGLASVQMGKKWGFINSRGDFLVQPYLDEAFPFGTGGMAPVRVDSDCYFIDSSGHRIESQRIDSDGELLAVHSFYYTSKNPLTLSGHIIKRNGFWGLVNLNGDELVPFIYDERITPYIEYFGRLLLCNKDNKVGIISDNNDVVLPCEYDSIEEIEDSDLAFLIKDGKWGLVDKDGAIVVDPIFENDVGYGDCFVDDLMPAMIAGKYGWIDRTGKFIIAPKYDHVGNFYNGLAVIGLNYVPHPSFNDGPHTSFGYLDKNGGIAIPPNFFIALDFQQDGLAFVNGVVGGKNVFGYIDKSGVLVRSALYPDPKPNAQTVD